MRKVWGMSLKIGNKTMTVTITRMRKWDERSTRYEDSERPMTRTGRGWGRERGNGIRGMGSEDKNLKRDNDKGEYGNKYLGREKYGMRISIENKTMRTRNERFRV